MKLSATLVAFGLVLGLPARAQFEAMTTPLAAVSEGGLALADLDGDGRLDLLTTSPTYDETVVYRNLGAGGTGFERVEGLGLPGTWRGGVLPADYDNDNDLDLLFVGSSSGQMARICRNDGAWVFTCVADFALDVSQNVNPLVTSPPARWLDADNDGRLDLVLSDGSGARLWLNLGGDQFRPSPNELPPLINASLDVGDVDGDGDVDILAASQPLPDSTLTAATTILLNQGGGRYAPLEHSLPSITFGNVRWSDYDADGDLDVLLVGDDDETFLSTPPPRLLVNDGMRFEERSIDADLPSTFGDWIDADVDGRLDLLLIGQDTSEVYQNEPPTFSRTPLALPGLFRGALAYGDIDADGRGDLVLMGLFDELQTSSLRVLWGTSPPQNTAPSRPPHLRAEREDDRAVFSWDAASDPETAAPGLTYNLRIGTTPGGTDVLSPMADLTSGARWLPAPGNAGHNRSWPIRLPDPNADYYWSVQAVDPGFRASPWAPEQVLPATMPTGTDVPPPTRGVVLGPSYPNPSSSSARLPFELPAGGPARLVIVDLLGRTIRVLTDGPLPAGAHEAVWDGRDGSGRRVAAGLYLCRLTATGRSVSQPLLLTE